MGATLGTASLRGVSREGPVPLEAGPFPVLLFSAAGFSPLSYAATVEELASHGHVVVSICHTFEAPVTVFEDGRSISANPEHLMKIALNTDDMQRAFDYRAGVAMLKRDDMGSVASALPTWDSPITRLLDMERLGAFGHSLGGNAALEFARTDDRCRVAVNLDGANWSEVGRIGLGKPAMIIAGEHPEMQGPPEAMVEAGAYPTVEWCLGERAVLFDGWQKVVDTAQPGAIRTIGGSRHANFADVQFVSLPEDPQVRAVLGPGNPEAVWREVCDSLLQFFAAHLT
jgi:hypothetical protein